MLSNATLERTGVLIIEIKTKYMRMSAKHDHLVTFRQNLNRNNHVFEHVEEFMYLGTSMRDDSDTTYEIERRITPSNRIYYSLRTQLPSQ